MNIYTLEQLDTALSLSGLVLVHHMTTEMIQIDQWEMKVCMELFDGIRKHPLFTFGHF